MHYIHQLADWPRLHWQEALLLTPLAEVRHQQGRLLGSMQTLGFSLRAEAHLHTMAAEVTQSSAIEGEQLDDLEVRSSLARRLGLDFPGAVSSSREVEGMVEMMMDATRNYTHPLTRERLCAWQASLFPAGRSGMRRITVGRWRTAESGPMQVVSGAVGQERVHFEAPSSERLEQEMQEFLAWFESESDLDLVLVAGVAHFRFVTIHPFEDGNGRIARAIADLALARADGSAQRFYSMSAQIEAERKEYYLALEQAQRGGTDITLWLQWFLRCLSRSIDRAEVQLAHTLHKAEAWGRINSAPVNERQRVVLNRLLDGFDGKLSSSKYAKLAKCSEDTALRDLRALLERGILSLEKGRGRSTRYRLAGP